MCTWIALSIVFILSAFLISIYDKNIFERKVETNRQNKISDEEFQDQFYSFVTEYKKSYESSSEFEKRFNVFKENYNKIIEHNSNWEEAGFIVEVNQFADLTLEEFKRTRLGLNGSTRISDSNPINLNKVDLSDLPKNVDWRVNGTFVNEIKDQGSWGSCWAFSAIGAIESAFAIKNGKLPILSEQQLVHCSKGFGNGGCSGGFMEYAFKYAEKYPLCTSEQYPYSATDSKGCTHQVCLQNSYKLAGFKDLELNSKKALYTALAAQPVSIGVCAGSFAWQFYKSGIIKRFWSDCLDHGVITVGYSDQGGDHIIVRNSWGSKWGEKGYLRISSEVETGKGTCGIPQFTLSCYCSA